MKYELRGVREDDLPYLSRNLRSADVHELYATYGHLRFLDVLERAVGVSEEALVGVPLGGNPVVLFGVRQATDQMGVVWACGTSEISRYRVPFLRNSRPVIQRWFEERPGLQYLMNFTHGSNTLHHRWLQWCGAELLPKVPWGALGDDFHPFTIRRDALCVIPD